MFPVNYPSKNEVFKRLKQNSKFFTKFSTKYMLSCLQNCKPFFIFLYFSQFPPPYFTSLLAHKTILTISANTLFLCTSAIFYLLIFTYIPIIPTENPFSYLNHSTN